MKIGIITNCLVCKKELSAVQIRKHGKYCALRCHHNNLRSENNSLRKEKIKLVCLVCGKNYQVIPALTKNGRSKVCSPECQTMWQSKYRIGKNSSRWKGGKVKRICKICGTNFPITPAKIRYGQGNFCSGSCKAIYQMKHMPNKQTSIELKVEEFLNSLGVKFESQKVIPEGKTIVDFYIPEQRLILYADGLYWHSRPGAKDKDCRQDFLLGMNGYTVLRLPEKEIKNNQFLKKIKQCLLQ